MLEALGREEWALLAEIVDGEHARGRKLDFTRGQFGMRAPVRRLLGPFLGKRGPAFDAFTRDAWARERIAQHLRDADAEAFSVLLDAVDREKTRRDVYSSSSSSSSK